jgi:two-component system, cell cycle response regulator CtrA
MYESARLKVDHVMGPQGPLTAADLPTPDTKRWTVRRKAEVVAAVRGGLMSLAQACRRYALDKQEFLSWQCCIDHYGLKGLQTTQIGELNMRVLLIEDDRSTAQSIERMLKSQRFNVYTTELGEDGVGLGKLYDFDIVLLDLNLPDMSGFEVLRSLRVCKVKTPILILSALAGIDEKVKGLTYGADDYVTKPFHKDELVARIHAIVRRSKGHAQCVIQTDDLVVNLDTRTVEINGAQVHLTGKEYQMLELLSLRKGTTLTKETFLNHLYGGMDEPEQKIIDVFICKLRKKLADASNGKDYFETVWGRGYMLRNPSADKAFKRSADLNASMTSIDGRPAVSNA